MCDGCPRNIKAIEQQQTLDAIERNVQNFLAQAVNDFDTKMTAMADDFETKTAAATAAATKTANDFETKTTAMVNDFETKTDAMRQDLVNLQVVVEGMKTREQAAISREVLKHTRTAFLKKIGMKKATVLDVCAIVDAAKWLVEVVHTVFPDVEEKDCERMLDLLFSPSVELEYKSRNTAVHSLTADNCGDVGDGMQFVIKHLTVGAVMDAAAASQKS